MKKKPMRWLLVFSLLLTAQSAFALETVTLQLKWKHAFQFAGYYAAKEQGYYREAGLEVNIVETSANINPVREVVEGRAQYGVGSSSLLLERAAGKPVVALAVIFQHSPYEIYASPSIHSLHDLVGKRIMIEPQADELIAYLKKEGIPLDQIQQIPHSFDSEDLINGKTEAMSGYLSNEPYYFNRAHYAYQWFSPMSAGLDFYGDNLFTTEHELKEHADRAKAFREASLRGWQYAKTHRDEVISLILKDYSKSHSRDYLQFESEQMIPLLQPDLIALGYMNPQRWQQIVDIYAGIGSLPHNFVLTGFLYDANQRDVSQLYRQLLIAGLLLLIIAGIALYILRTNRQLRTSLQSLDQAKEALIESEHHYRLLVENMHDVVWILDTETLRFRYVSPSVAAMRGYTDKEMMDESMDAVTIPEHAAELKLRIQRQVAEFAAGLAPDRVYIEELQQQRKDGSLIWAEAIFKLYRNEENGHVEMHGVTRDISERKAAHDEIRRLAMYDTLTGLPNRKLLNERLHQALMASKRERTQGALMFLDLDKFKQINDTLGHDVGDQLLKQAAARMQECVRESDTVARIGGDEFIVFLRTIETPEDALKVAEKIRFKLCQTFEIGQHRFEISSSIGVAIYPQHGQNEDELSKNADLAMYQAKQNGRNNVQLFDESNKPD
jgi:diguanylate cyclase (GGDEF)-like protein/PAS domain S-box-containing protein